jgi:hypothetical protein
MAREMKIDVAVKNNFGGGTNGTLVFGAPERYAVIDSTPCMRRRRCHEPAADRAGMRSSQRGRRWCGDLAAWVASQSQLSVAAIAGVALTSATLAAVLTWRALQRWNVGSGVLVWDGADWQWSPGHGQPGNSQPTPGKLRVMIDLGAWILLRFAPGTSSQAGVWLTVSRRQAGTSWPLWRAVVFSRRPSPDAIRTADPS